MTAGQKLFLFRFLLLLVPSSFLSSHGRQSIRDDDDDDEDHDHDHAGTDW